MTELVYQAKAGDGYLKKGMKRTNTFFMSAQEAVAEALALKEKMDKKYKNEIQWDYNTKLSRSSKTVNILKGYLGGVRETSPFYLQIVCMEQDQDYDISTPIKPKKMNKNDKEVVNKVVKFLN
ncbi:hypothetical protein ACFSCX_13135 [Bacillus salitolerans]|uniref:Uncharacterized protein n=1 Tax=Bacillus salitolerans TaxID=1437434 RepID=A0ABW4LS51_9BACI